MKTVRERLKKFFEDFYLVLVLIFLYAPILVMMVLSFNSSKSRSHWGGFTLQWYKQMFESASIMDALYNTLLIAFLRPTLAGMICGRDNVREGGIPSSARLGERKFITYLVALTLVHHAVFFSLEALSWTHALHTLLRIVVSTAVSAGFIWIIARIFTAKIPVRI